jgi:hypothetical protein
VIRAAVKAVRPVLDLIELHFLRFQLATINPMAPQLGEILQRVADLERPM